MKTLNISTLLADLEKSASIEKAASVAEPIKPNVSAELAHILEKKASEDVTASALAAGEALAKELLTKIAEENEIQKGDAIIIASDDKKILPNQTAGSIDAPIQGTVEAGVALGAKSDDLVDPILDKEAQTKLENTKMANHILEKLALSEVGVTPTTPAVGAGVATATPNLIQIDNDAMLAFDDKKVEALPGAEGTLNSILEAVVARAKEQGAASADLVNGDAPASVAEGARKVITPEEQEQEKAAAVSALVEAGADFGTAVELVKQAEEALAEETDQQEKIAAVEALCDAGYSFDDAISLVKAAEEEIKKDAKKEGTSEEEKEQEKKAAFTSLIEAGVDFSSAVEMVKVASLEVYGE
jgi:hypothetical protein